MKAGQRLGELDALRGIAAVGILLWHYAGHFGARPLSFMFAPFYTRGLYLVDFFFVLSGFILCTAYLNDERKSKLKENIIRRLARLYPLHFVTLIFTVIVQLVLVTSFDKSFFVYQFNDAFHFILNLFLAQFIGLQDGMSFNGPSWSISTEFYVSLLFFIVLAFAKRPASVFLVILVAAMGFFALDQETTLIQTGNVLFLDAHLVRTVLGFSAGVLLYKVVSAWSPKRTWLFDLSFVYGIFILMAAGASQNNFWLTDFAVVVLGFPFLIYAVLNGKLVPEILRSRPLTFLGSISYSLYLIHFPVQLLFHTAKVSGLVVFRYENPVTLMVFCLVSIICGGLTYYLLEVPIKSLISNRWANRN